MGLDAVELILEIEDKFGVNIHDAEAEKIRTVGDLFEFLNRRLAYQSSCPGMTLFHRIRKRLVEVLEVDRCQIRPSTRLDELLPIERRRLAWAALKTEPEVLAHRLPELRLSLPAKIFVRAGSSLVTESLIVMLFCYADWPLIIVGTIVLLIARLIAGTHLKDRLATQLPEELLTLRDLTLALLPERTSATLLSPEEIWAELQDIIMRMLGVRRELVVPGASFVNDLGLN